MSNPSSHDGLALPHSAVLAWWLTAWLRGHEQTDHVLDALADDVHLLEGGSALDLLARSRASGASYAGLALPVDGDPLGLGGPRDFSAAALEAGQAVVAGGLGLVPHEAGDTVQWRVHEAAMNRLHQWRVELDGVPIHFVHERGRGPAPRVRRRRRRACAHPSVV